MGEGIVRRRLRACLVLLASRMVRPAHLLPRNEPTISGRHEGLPLRRYRRESFQPFLMSLHVLPLRTAGAAENMAIDFLLLQRYPEQSASRFRHYEWRAPAFTFGYSQKIAYVRANLPSKASTQEGLPHLFNPELCRRATGGGIVDHRNDWTYALVLPRGLALYDARATQAYHDVHVCLVEALVALGQPVVLKASCDPVEGCEGEPLSAMPTICFVRAELYDVLNSVTGEKIAGAAMKRNKHGLLFQGSIEKSRLGPIDWEEFQVKFTTALGRLLGSEAEEVPWPELNEDEVSGLTEQYSAPEWNEAR